MSFYKRELLNHFHALRPALQRLGAEAFIDPCTLVLRVRIGTARHTFHPQFMAIRGGITQFFTRFEDDAVRFTGWCPCVNQRWPLAEEKLVFKRFATHNGLRTPDYSVDPLTPMRDVILKRSASSFSEGIKGPFRSASEHSLDPGAGEYFERFIPGRLTKIWYCNERPVCLEFERMAFVQGNGVSSIRGLARAILRHRGRKMDIDELTPFLAYQGITLDTVLKRNEEQVIEFRFGSNLLVPDGATDVDLVANMIPSLESDLRDVGRKLWDAIREDVHPNTIFTVDAVLDEEERLWVLEMNSNPYVHPYVYPAMLEQTFSGKAPAAGTAGAAGSRATESASST